MKSTDPDLTYGHGLTLDLKPGNAWMLYTDDGPTGPGGQDGRTNSPLTLIHTFENEDDMRSFVATFKPRARNGKVSCGVVDGYYAGSVLRFIDHRG